MDTRIPSTEKKFIEEILYLLDEEPDKINPMSDDGSNCLYIKRDDDKSARVADNCIIGKWLVSKGFTLHQDFIIQPASAIFCDFLTVEQRQTFGVVADQIQEFADNKGNPIPWRKVSSEVRKFYELELAMEGV